MTYSLDATTAITLPVAPRGDAPATEWETYYDALDAAYAAFAARSVARKLAADTAPLPIVLGKGNHLYAPKGHDVAGVAWEIPSLMSGLIHAVQSAHDCAPTLTLEAYVVADKADVWGNHIFALVTYNGVYITLQAARVDPATRALVWSRYQH